MRSASLFLIIFILCSYIFCQTITSTQNSSTNSNGVQTDTQILKYDNGSTVTTIIETTSTTITKTVRVETNGNTNQWVSSTPNTGSGTKSDSATLITTNIQDNGAISIVTNTYSNGSTVVTTTERNGNSVTITVKVTDSNGAVNQWVSTTNGGSPATTPSTPATTPSTPATTPSTPATTPSTPATTPSTPATTPSTPATTPSTPATTPSTPATTPTGPTTQNPVTLPSTDPYSAYNYKVPSSISYDDIKRIHLEYINGARSCMGLANLTWDDTLAAHAQAWANTCNMGVHAGDSSSPKNPTPGFGGNPFSPTVGEGENIYNFAGSGLTAIGAMQNGNEFFNGEVNNYDCANNQCSGTCGHYTQNLWSTTTRLGCGVAICGQSFSGVCRYSERGNYNFPQVHVFGSAQACNSGLGFSECKKRINNIAGKGLIRTISTNTNTQSTNTQSTNQSRSFFTSDSQIVVFALVITIAVMVAAIFVLLFVTRRRTSNKELEYQLLETK